jgi:hypothetical protein
MREMSSHKRDSICTIRIGVGVGADQLGCSCSHIEEGCERLSKCD